MGIYKCPVCTAMLQEEERLLICSKGHSFDKAHENYVNLLPGNRKNSKDPGDSKEMMASRRAFLDSGYYNRFSQSLTELVSTLACQGWESVLDSGCGEGYYISNMKNAFRLTQDFREVIKLYGMDISKHMVRAAARRYKEISFFVGSSFDIPMIDGAVDCVIRNFAPGDNREFHRILKKDGRLVIITPGTDHLYGLKAALYEQPRHHEMAEHRIDGFRHLERCETRYDITLDKNSDIKNLISMTPYYWSIKPETRSSMDKIEQLSTLLHFVFDVYRKD